MRLGKFIKKNGNDYFFERKDDEATLIFIDGLNWYIKYDVTCYDIKDTIDLISLNIQFNNWFLINGGNL